MLRRHIITNHKDGDTDTPLPPLRKNKTKKASSKSSGSTSPVEASVDPPSIDSSTAGSKPDDAGAELLHNFQQNGQSVNGSSISTMSPLLASPPEGNWYDSRNLSPPNVSTVHVTEPQPYAGIQNNQLLQSMYHSTPSMQQTSPLVQSTSNGLMNHSIHDNLGQSQQAQQYPQINLPQAEWEPLFPDVLGSSSNPFAGLTPPISTDQFWESTPFDFSGLFAQEPWNLPAEFKRPFSPPVSESTPAENLANIWPTRPSRRKTACCSVGYDYPDIQSTEWNGHVLWNKRMYVGSASLFSFS